MEPGRAGVSSDFFESDFGVFNFVAATVNNFSLCLAFVVLYVPRPIFAHLSPLFLSLLPPGPTYELYGESDCLWYVPEEVPFRH